MLEINESTLNKINNITTRINSALDLHSLLTAIMDTTRELLDVEAASLLLYDKETDELIFDIARGARGELLAQKRLPPGQGIAGMCAASKEPIVVNDAQNDSRLLRSIDKELNYTTRNLMAVPMLARSEMIGVLEIVNSADNREFSRIDIRLMKYLANMAALAIQNRKLFEELKSRADELNCIYEISQNMHLHDKLEDALTSIVQSIVDVMGVKRVSVFLKNETTGKMDLIKQKGFAEDSGDILIDSEDGIAKVIMRSGDPLLVRDIEKEFRLLPSHAGRYSTKSFVSVPIKSGDLVIGILNIADKNDSTPFDIFELKILSTIAGQLDDVYSRARARKKEIELVSYRKDLETAALIQQNSLPQIPKEIAGLEVATRYEASRDVGGDFYDLIYHNENCISLIIADVAGKGVPAALFMEYSKTLLAGQVLRSMDPVATLGGVSNEIFSNSKMTMFVTVMLVLVEKELSRIRFSSAGHNNQVLHRRKKNEIELLSTKGPPVGIIGNGKYQEKIAEYDPGDILILFTDGITEANNSKYEEFGEEKLYEIIKSNKDQSPGGLVDLIFTQVNEFRGGMASSDDATMMVVRL